jgi:hypothetical protein
LFVLDSSIGAIHITAFSLELRGVEGVERSQFG